VFERGEIRLPRQATQAIALEIDPSATPPPILPPDPLTVEITRT